MYIKREKEKERKNKQKNESICFNIKRNTKCITLIEAFISIIFYFPYVLALKHDSCYYYHNII